MICLTGDVHHMSMRTHDQKRLSGTEAEAASRYVEIAVAKGLKVTLFATGRAVADEPEAFRELGRSSLVELGGHGFRGRHPRWLYEFVFRRGLRLQNGPAFYQGREIRRTVRVFRAVLGREIRSWRDHALRTDRNTLRSLAAAGIRTVSDDIGPESADPVDIAGIRSLPINVWPDHDCLAHGVYSGALPARAESRAAGFPDRYLSKEAWLRAVVGRVERIEARGGLAMLLVHPACMGVLDRFETFASLCAALAGCRSATAEEAGALWIAKGAPR